MQGRDETPLRGLVAAEEVLAGGARGGELEAKGEVLARNEIDRLQQRGRTARELTGRPQHLREPDERAQACGTVVVRHQTQRGRIPACGARGRPGRVHIACLYVQSLHLFPRRAREAWDMLEDAERRVLRIRKEHFLRKESLNAIAHARAVAMERQR